MIFAPLFAIGLAPDIKTQRPVGTWLMNGLGFCPPLVLALDWRTLQGVQSAICS